MAGTLVRHCDDAVSFIKKIYIYMCYEIGSPQVMVSEQFALRDYCEK
jgi:hypothetical protein